MEDTELAAGIALIRRGFDALLQANLTSLAKTELPAAMSELETELRRAGAVDQRLIFEMTERGTAGDYGRTSPIDLLVNLLRISPGEAKTRVNLARDLGPRRTIGGEPLPPILPLVAAAVKSGEISRDHAREIIRAVEKIPDRYADQYGEIVEAALVTQARLTHPVEVARAGQALLARIDQDGEEPRDEERERRRDFGLGRRADGTRVPRGSWTPIAGALWDAILDSLSAPVPGPNGEPDPRTAGQRRHDAMIEAGLRLVRSSALPDCGGTPVSLLAHINIDDLTTQLIAQAERDGIDLTAFLGQPEPTIDDEPVDDDEPVEDEPVDGVDSSAEVIGVWAANRAERRGARRAARRARFTGAVVRTAHGDLISLSELLRLASEAQIIPVVLNSAGGIVAYGRTRRLATAAQRRALAARDRGCSFPGCTRPPAWCESHHIIPWLIGGRTDLDNLCLLCSYHHREFERQGWIVRMSRDGVPEWTPPDWLDPEHVPIRNTAHHLLDFEFDYQDTG